MDHSDPTFNQLQIGNLALHKTNLQKKKFREAFLQTSLYSYTWLFGLPRQCWIFPEEFCASVEEFEFRSLKTWTARCSLSLYRAFLYDIWNNNLLNFFLRVGILRFHHIKTLGLIIRGIEKEKTNPQQIFL